MNENNSKIKEINFHIAKLKDEIKILENDEEN